MHLSTDASSGRLLRIGVDLVLDWADGVTCALTAWRDGREGVKGELTVRQHGARRSWGSWSLSSTTAREGLAKRLGMETPEVPWRAHLEEAAWRFTEAVRVGEPLTTLTGQTTQGPPLLLPGWLYEGEPTLLYADGDTGKSLTALTMAVAMQTGRPLPGGLLPVRPVVAAYLDWETSPATVDERLGLVAAGFGVTPPTLLYKRMTRPLVDEVGRLSTEFASRKVGFVVVDSKMFAVAGGDGAAFHEPITAFYSALRLFAPAAVLVLNHVTNADARTGVPARPFGGAFAFNGPRLIWEAKRDHEVEDATAIVFTCRKANNLARKPEAFGLRFREVDRGIEVSALNLTEVAPATLAGAKLPTRITAMLSEPLSVEQLAEALQAKTATVVKTLHRLRGKAYVAQLEDGRWISLRHLSGRVSESANGGHRATSVPPPAPPIGNYRNRSNNEAKTETSADLPFLSVPSGHCPDTLTKSPANRVGHVRTVVRNVRDEPAWITEGDDA